MHKKYIRNGSILIKNDILFKKMFKWEYVCELIALAKCLGARRVPIAGAGNVRVATVPIVVGCVHICAEMMMNGQLNLKGFGGSVGSEMS